MGAFEKTSGETLARIIQFDATKKKPKAEGKDTQGKCDHKDVIAYTVFRKVHCAICGVELDPFDVLVDMLKAYVPDIDLEEKRLQNETEKRDRDGS